MPSEKPMWITVVWCSIKVEIDLTLKYQALPFWNQQTPFKRRITETIVFIKVDHQVLGKNMKKFEQIAEQSHFLW